MQFRYVAISKLDFSVSTVKLISSLPSLHRAGILNYYIGKKAADEGRDARYPDIDFCKDPGAICSRDDHKELKWIGE